MADNGAAFAALSAHIARIRKLPEMGKLAVAEVADELRRESERHISAGRDPDGKPLQLTQDGRKPLQGVRVKIGAVGKAIHFHLSGHHARHHLGRARGGIERRLMPTDRIPDRYSAAIVRTLERKFAELMGGNDGG